MDDVWWFKNSTVVHDPSVFSFGYAEKTFRIVVRYPNWFRTLFFSKKRFNARVTALVECLGRKLGDGCVVKCYPVNDYVMMIFVDRVIDDHTYRVTSTALRRLITSIDSKAAVSVLGKYYGNMAVIVPSKRFLVRDKH